MREKCVVDCEDTVDGNFFGFGKGCSEGKERLRD